MKLPLSWLNDYVEISATAEEIGDALTNSGTEIEGILRIGEGCEGVVVGEVLTTEPHPNADRLTLCHVSDGTQEVPVVCGAPNVAAGQKVALAPVGCTLPGGMKIKQAKLRGVVSQGMLCAEDELGFADNHEGIMVLPADATVGTPFLDAVGGIETVLELEVTWNRPDCLSIIGLARELSALYGVPLRRPEIALPTAGASVDERVAVTIQDAAACPRYTARLLSGVGRGPSPLWMQRRLQACGVRAINAIVDITNYVMLECGQPLHAFDFAALEGEAIVVRRAKPDEAMATLDGTSRTLTAEMLVIADHARPVAVAGVMGGAGSEIGPQTEHVLLESACFDPALTHRTSVALGLSTESSHRFERGVDVGNVEWASQRAASLMAELCGGVVAPGVIDQYPGESTPQRIRCDLRRAGELLGTEVNHEEGRRVLEALEIPVCEATAEQITVEAPSFRRDLEREADIVEELARMQGLDRVPAADPVARIVVDADDRRTRALRQCRENLRALGLAEVMHYSFLSEALLERVHADDPARRVVLPDPVSADHGVMRPSLMPQLLETLGHNLAHQVGQVACYEIGRRFRKDETGALIEDEVLALGLLGLVGDGSARRAAKPEEVFLRAKGILTRLGQAQGCEPIRIVADEAEWAEPGWCGAVQCGERVIGTMGLVRADVRHRWRMQEPVALVEIDVAPLVSQVYDVPSFTPLAAFPAMERDVAVIVDEGVSHARISEEIRASAPPELTSIELFDIFRNGDIGAGRKSMAYALTYRSRERTLTDEEVNRGQDVIMAHLRSELNAEIREG